MPNFKGREAEFLRSAAAVIEACEELQAERGFQEKSGQGVQTLRLFADMFERGEYVLASSNVAEEV